MQIDLFAPTFDGAPEIQAGWEARALRELPSIYSFPGFMGSVCERLVAKGLAHREAAPAATRPDWWPVKDKTWVGRIGPQFRYTVTEAGRARLMP